MDKLDAIFSLNSAWSLIDPCNLEELRIPQCADQFVRLLDAIQERYCNLPQPGHQLQFLNLQLELIENFRRRVTKLHGNAEGGVSTTMVLNAINYINSVLREWGENVVCVFFFENMFEFIIYIISFRLFYNCIDCHLALFTLVCCAFWSTH